jgi:hypothetical protein
MKAVRYLETLGNTKPTTKRHVAFSAAPLCIPHVSHSIPFLLPSLNFKITRLARIQLQFETHGVDAYICTYVYLYTFYRIFIWVLYLLGREKECVYVYTFCRCIRVIVCFPIIMLWTNLRFRHIANALSQYVFQELVSFCMPLRETNTLYDTICVGTWSLQTCPRLGQSQTSCGCSFHFILWPWVKHYSVEVYVVTSITGVHNFTEFARVCRACFTTQTIGWWWNPLSISVPGNDTKRQSVLKDVQFKIFLLSVSFPWI